MTKIQELYWGQLKYFLNHEINRSVHVGIGYWSWLLCSPATLTLSIREWYVFLYWRLRSRANLRGEHMTAKSDEVWVSFLHSYMLPSSTCFPYAPLLHVKLTWKRIFYGNRRQNLVLWKMTFNYSTEGPVT